MAYIDIVKTGELSKNSSSDDGKTRNVFSGDDSATWTRGQILLLASGVVTDAVTGAAEIDKDDIAVGSTVFVASEAQAAATSGKVPVQKVSSSMVFQAVLVQTSTDSLPTAPESIIGNTYELYQNAAGKWGVDKDSTGPKDLVQVVGVESQETPFVSDVVDYIDHSGTDVRYPYVFVSFLPEIVDQTDVL